jgi:hypothetical protein
MAFFKRDKEKERFYLLPGQGGRALRQKNKVFLTWAIIAAVIVASAFGYFLYYSNLRH